MQLITYFEKLFKANRIPVWLLSYRIVSTSKSTGLIQLIPDAISLDGLKKGDSWPGTLRAHFEQKYGAPETSGFKTAMDAYVKSLAGYSIVTYILAIKDR
jgi:phosphatidylinositol kinase/protein kinase (PI-3  family)